MNLLEIIDKEALRKKNFIWYYDKANSLLFVNSIVTHKEKK